MRVQVLISCMFDTDYSVVKQTNLQSDAIVVNQCDHDSREIINITSKTGKECCVTYINTTERGLSRSRNMAIRNSDSDICLLCDDDEYLEDDYKEKIIRAYLDHPNENIIVFVIERRDYDEPKSYPLKEGYVGLKQLLQTSSVQITFKKEAIISKGISFDIMLGSGTGNGAGEENKFLMDCKRAGLKIYYVPVCLGAVLSGNSSWFKGYTQQFMRNQGWTSRRALGPFLGMVYIFVYGFRHRELFKNNMSIFCAYKNLFKGYFEKRS